MQANTEAAIAFGQLLRELRAAAPGGRRKKLSQTEIAEALGKHPTYVTHSERGVLPPTRKQLPVWAKLLGVDHGELLRLWLLMQGQVPLDDTDSSESVSFTDPNAPLPLPDYEQLDPYIRDTWDAEHKLAWAIAETAHRLFDGSEAYRGRVTYMVESQDWPDTESAPPDDWDPAPVAEVGQIARRTAATHGRGFDLMANPLPLWSVIVTEALFGEAKPFTAAERKVLAEPLVGLIQALDPEEKAMVTGYIHRLLDERTLPLR